MINLPRHRVDWQSTRIVAANRAPTPWHVGKLRGKYRGERMFPDLRPRQGRAAAAFGEAPGLRPDSHKLLKWFRNALRPARCDSPPRQCGGSPSPIQPLPPVTSATFPVRSNSPKSRPHLLVIQACDNVRRAFRTSIDGAAGALRYYRLVRSYGRPKGPFESAACAKSTFGRSPIYAGTADMRHEADVACQNSWGKADRLTVCAVSLPKSGSEATIELVDVRE